MSTIRITQSTINLISLKLSLDMSLILYSINKSKSPTVKGINTDKMQKYYHFNKKLIISRVTTIKNYYH